LIHGPLLPLPSKKKNMESHLAVVSRLTAMSYLQQKVEINRGRWARVQPWVAALLSEHPAPPAGSFPLAEAEQEGVLPWLAYRMHEAGMLQGLGEQEAAVREVLNRCAVQHMLSERELERLLGIAETTGIEFVAIKGHAVGRTLYPHPACRPTSDLDLLVSPEQVEAAQALLREAGYRPLNRYIGHGWLASQSWLYGTETRARHSVDLHWDITNRMYFRHRVNPVDLIQASPRVPCGNRSFQVTNLFDSTAIACVHIAAFKPGLLVQLRWLLDVRLLLAAIPGEEIPAFIERMADWRAVEACRVFGEAAAKLDDSPALGPVLRALRNAASEERMAEYDRTLRSRSYDLWRYWLRLPASGKVSLIGEGMKRGFRR
jgi:hypothetical protein